MPDDAERIRALTAAVDRFERRESGLQTSIDELRESVDEQNRHNTQKIRWTIGACAFAVILSAMVSVGYLKQVDTGERLAQTAGRLEGIVAQQDLLRYQVLCPLYKVLLGSYDPGSRKAGPDRDKYENVFADMRQQYTALACVGDLVPPRGDLVTRPPR